MNTAVLTGRQVSQVMKVFIVTQAGKVADVTLQSSCHAEDESVIKVSVVAAACSHFQFPSRSPARFLFVAVMGDEFLILSTVLRCVLVSGSWLASHSSRSRLLLPSRDY
jgi:hypothetical protein